MSTGGGRKALVVGGGIAGAGCAIETARSGFSVTLVERDPEWRALGSGITMIGPALRALDRLGLLDEALSDGAGVTTLDIRAPGGESMWVMDLPRLLGLERPGLLGMMRPTLHRVLADAVRAEGVVVRAGTEVVGVTPSSGQTRVRFADGSEEEFDLVVAADGVHSTLRGLVAGQQSGHHAGQVVFRAVLPRHPEVTGSLQFVGHPRAKAGFTPTGADTMYLFCNVPGAAGERIPADEAPTRLREELQPFGGIVAEVRDQITDPALVDARTPEWLLMPLPWHRGCVVFVGDAAHCTTPHLAAGAAMALEDGVVLGEELRAAGDIDQALAAFTERRAERCTFVVEGSATLAEWEVNPSAPGADYMGFMRQATGRLAQDF